MDKKSQAEKKIKDKNKIYFSRDKICLRTAKIVINEMLCSNVQQASSRKFQFLSIILLWMFIFDPLTDGEHFHSKYFSNIQKVPRYHVLTITAASPCCASFLTYFFCCCCCSFNYSWITIWSAFIGVHFLWLCICTSLH